MNFTYKAYLDLLSCLKQKGYAFSDYHNYEKEKKCVILRHDVDYCLDAAVKMAEVEAQQGVASTYFVLLCTDFYNLASAKGRRAIEAIQSFGHEIGLHFDEAVYDANPEDVCGLIQKEVEILSQITRSDISTVSMHRPSKATLEGNYQLPGLINSYGRTFFHDFKYLSDSRRNWREPVTQIVESGEYDRLHILTHAFWYHEADVSLEDTVRTFIQSANMDRYNCLAENIRDIESILKCSDI